MVAAGKMPRTRGIQERISMIPHSIFVFFGTTSVYDRKCSQLTSKIGTIVPHINTECAAKHVNFEHEFE